jgi:hypothetical protein
MELVGISIAVLHSDEMRQIAKRTDTTMAPRLDAGFGHSLIANSEGDLVISDAPF